uniref:Pyrroline-5-carboxylate reductase 1a n=1 Tax=Echeneis naucrates TaxID=173247 RepID=A0A665VL32_ECHNA
WGGPLSGLAWSPVCNVSFVQKFGVNSAASNIETVNKSGILFQAVKLQINLFVPDEIGSDIYDHRLIVSCSVGVNINYIEKASVFTTVDALTDGGVKMGIHRRLAVCLGTQALPGAIRMLLDPERLKDNVCSPGGGSLFCSLLINAVEAFCVWTRELKFLDDQEKIFSPVIKKTTKLSAATARGDHSSCWSQTPSSFMNRNPRIKKTLFVRQRHCSL